MTIHHLRRNYTFGSLSRSDLPVEPIQLFKDWFAQLHATELPDWFEVNAMTLSTSNLAEGVSSRIVLLKHLDDDGFLFFTNYDSAKGHQIAIDPHVAIHFYWPIFDRQVRIEGKATKTSAEISNNYFESRPRTSQLGAVVSPQSEIISDDAQLARDIDELDKKCGGQSIPRPENWGGYKVTPLMMEFWQGKPSRLHDRFRYQLNEQSGVWTIDRLAP